LLAWFLATAEASSSELVDMDKEHLGLGLAAPIQTRLAGRWNVTTQIGVLMILTAVPYGISMFPSGRGFSELLIPAIWCWWMLIAAVVGLGIPRLRRHLLDHDTASIAN
jgi:hypothetical protein